jgi:hypothetical protein
MTDAHPTSLLDAYVDYILEEGKQPPSVYKFCKGAGLTETEFFQEYASFEALEGAVWRELVDKALASIEADPSYGELSARQKVLAFFYAFVEQATARRSFLLVRFPGYHPPAFPAALGEMGEAFRDFIKPVLESAQESGEIAGRGRLNEAYPHFFQQQLLFVLDFNLKDTSKRFERTDALIEKSVNLTFDLLEKQVVESAFDLLRFLGGRHHTTA